MPAFVYRAYGMAMLSEVELPGLPTSDCEPEFAIRIGHVAPLKAGTEPYCSIRGSETIYSNRFARFRLRCGREITVDPLPEAPEAAVRVVLMGKVMSLALRQRGWLPLHAS